MSLPSRIPFALPCTLAIGFFAAAQPLQTSAADIEPQDAQAYRDRLAADAKRDRPIDPDWAQELTRLLGPDYRFHHTAHFTLLTNTGQDTATTQADAMEQTYAAFYRDASAIGLRPMPPETRLVCALFDKYEQYRDYLRQHEQTNAAWTSGHYSWKTNRVAFFHDRDNPAFADVRRQITINDKRLADLRSEMRVSTRKTAVQRQINALDAANADMNHRLTEASRLATLGKTRHETTHQLLYNSRLFRPGREYPFWLNEGLACGFEIGDPQGRAGPAVVNRYRLKTYQDAQQAGKLIPLHELILRQPSDDADIAHVATDYAQAWALVHFLWNNQPVKLRNYIQAIDKAPSTDWPALFRKHFGEDLTTLDRQLRQHIDTL